MNASSNPKADAPPTFKEVLFVPWGKGPDRLDPQFSDALPAGLALDPNRILVAASVQVRIDAHGNFHLLQENTGRWLQFGADGNWLSERTLSGNLRLFQPYEEGYLTLQGGDKATLVYQGQGDKQIWTHDFTDDELAEPDQLLVRDKRIVVASLRGDGGMVEIDGSNGNLKRKLHPTTSNGKWYWADNSHLASVAWFSDKNLRGIAHFDLDQDREERLPFPKAWYGALATEFGADAQGGLFLRTTPTFADDYAIVNVSKAAKTVASVPLWALLPIEGGSVRVANLDSNSITLTDYPSGKVQHVRLPNELGNDLGDKLMFTGTDNQGNLQFDVRKSPIQLGQRLHVDAKGHISRSDVPKGDIISEMQPADTWQIGPDGEIYIPVRTPKGLSIVRMDW